MLSPEPQNHKLVDEAFLLEILDHSRTPLFVKNRQHQLMLVNDALCELVGMERVDIIGKSDHDLYSEEEAAGFCEMDEKVFSTRVPIEYEETITDTNNVSKTLRTTKNVFDTASGESLLVGTIHDITELRGAQNQLEDAITHLSMIALTDTLTGLSNRTQFETELTNQIQQATVGDEDHVFSVVFIDLNGFKVINDTAGHLVGDEILRICSDRLRNQLRGDSKIARVGGDEFLLLLPETDAAKANLIVNRLMNAFRAPIKINDADWHVACSIGIAMYPSDGETSAELIRNADFAMYEAKKRKRNDGVVPCSSVEFFRSQIGNAMERRRKIECALNFSEYGNSIQQYYQPIVAKAESDEYQILGFESLARWQLDGKTVSPEEFIPILEKGGGIVPFGYTIIESACRYISEQCNPDQFVSVNLTYTQIMDKEFCEIVESTIRKAGIRPEQLALELTEQDANIEKVVATTVFEKLRRIGVRTMIDDFGSGYSNLSRLGSFPLDVVKLDKSLLQDLRLLKSVMCLVRELALMTIVEGIETEEQVARVTEFGADMLQGYYFGRPQDESYDWKTLFMNSEQVEIDIEATVKELASECSKFTGYQFTGILR